MFDWDDLRLFLAAARAGSLTGAAARLGIDAATVGRRIARLETATHSTLVVRSPQGLELTAAGTRLLGHAMAAETAMNAALEGSGDAASGVVRISVSEGFGTEIIAPALPDLSDTGTAFAHMSGRDLQRARLLFGIISSPVVTKVGSWATKAALALHLPIKPLIKATVFRQFVGGETIDESLLTAARLDQRSGGRNRPCAVHRHRWHRTAADHLHRPGFDGWRDQHRARTSDLRPAAGDAAFGPGLRRR